MSDTAPKDVSACRLIVFFAMSFWVLTSPWTLQAFVPEPYFIRSLHQLREMNTSLSLFYLTIGAEVAVLLIQGALVWGSRSTGLALMYLLAVIAMAGITLWRLYDALSGIT
jgi:hypothetical protein